MRKFYIAVDLQHDFISGSLGSELAKIARSNAIKVIKNIHLEDYLIFTKDTHYEDDYDTSLEGKLLPIKHCIVNTPGWSIDEVIRYTVIQYVPESHRYSLQKETFGTFEIGKILKTLNIRLDDEIVLFGLCTDICVISNALILRAEFPNNRIYCVKDACAGTSLDKHNSALKVMESCQIEVI